MKINNNSQISNFSGIPLIKTSLQKQVYKGFYRPIDAFVSFMEKADLEKEGMKNRIWGESKYGANIIFDAEEYFRNPFRKTAKRFLLVESPQEMEYCSIKAIASIFTDAEQIRGALLQSLRPHECLEPVKGAGLMVLYTMSKIAEKLKKAQIFLTSRGKQETIDFYRHMGMIEKENNTFVLPSDMFKSFQQRIEEKFPVARVFEENIN
ncbi:MAG: hypothetical protein K6A44_00800 [bacterium]|nr:hypothetical protein [bacterium]